MSELDTNNEISENEQVHQRKMKLAELRKQGIAYPNGFIRKDLAADLHQAYGHLSNEELASKNIQLSLAGRMMTRRIMGKASFATMQDMSGKIQAYIAKDQVNESTYEAFKHWDLGDIISVEGVLFKTKTGELSIKAKEINLLVKALRPLPDKFHGLSDIEQRSRQRYLDLMVNEESRRVFLLRSKIVAGIRQFLNKEGFMEVETPMLQVQAGGAAAKPFHTHHNALDMDLVLRIAPELYLKRLVVGGFEKVYELNRNFRNEGISTRHNPEFTMVEFYQAYAVYGDLMNLTELMFRTLAKEVLGCEELHYQDHIIDLTKPFQRLTLRESIAHFNPEIKLIELDHFEQACVIAKQHKIEIFPGSGLGKVQTLLFEELVEKKLKQPTFITEFPVEVSPLARPNDKNPFVADRFELYAGGQEIANGFSELNDPEDQAARFHEQLKAREAGDEEAMSYDEDYITALEYGLPPTAGEGIGVDRLVMLFANCSSIREVILFPLLRQKNN